MATDYDAFYRDNPHGLGEPTRQFVAFFADFAQPRARVLDVGCGQGRDALFIARLGHRVTAVDSSVNGIRDLERDARREGLAIDAMVADIRSAPWEGLYDVIVVDRTLHMLDARERLGVLDSLVEVLEPAGHVLIADEPRNLPATLERLKSEANWRANIQRKGPLFLQREPA